MHSFEEIAMSLRNPSKFINLWSKPACVFSETELYMYLILKHIDSQANTKSYFKNNDQKYKQIPKMGATDQPTLLFNCRVEYCALWI